MKEYAAVFEKTTTGWSAYVPDLPRLGVTGASFEETKTLLREGIEFHLEGLREDGDNRQHQKECDKRQGDEQEEDSRSACRGRRFTPRTCLHLKDCTHARFPSRR